MSTEIEQSKLINCDIEIPHKDSPHHRKSTITIIAFLLYRIFRDLPSLLRDEFLLLFNFMDRATCSI